MRTRDLVSTGSGGSRRAASIVAATVVGACLLFAPPQAGQAVEPVVASAGRTIAIADESVPWTPSANARVKAIRPDSSAAALQVKPKREAGRKTISMRSPLSTDVIPTAGTTVTAKARIRTSQPGRRLTFRLHEINRGRAVASRSVSVVPSSRGWRDVTVTLRTTRADSRVQLSTRAKRLRGTHVVRVADVTVSVPTPPPTGPTDPGGGGPGTPPTPTTCEDIDYSDPAQGVRTFTEDFNGTSLDRSTWRVRDNTFLNQDQAWITKDAVSVRDGNLLISGKRLPESQWKTNTRALYPTNVTRNYSTGYIDTIDSAGYGNAAGNRFGQKYGHFEIRALVPSQATMSRGIWPAFWLRADHEAGEIDPLESYGAPTIRSFDPSSSYEWNSWADTAEGSMSGIVKRQTHGRADVGTDKIWQNWHTYGVNWSPGCLRYLYDGRTVGLVDFDDPDTASYFREKSFDDTFHIRLNMQIGSNYWGWSDPAHTRNDFDFKVDWVRVYQGKDLLTAP